MTNNKKVLGATSSIYNYIQFKSKLELMAYKTLIEHDLSPLYEPYKLIIWQGFKPSVPFYTKNNNNSLSLNEKKLINITYTPDIYLEYNEHKIFIEMKGFQNDIYPIKLKLFRKYIEDLPDSDKYMLFEIYSKKQLLEAIKIIKQL